MGDPVLTAARMRAAEQAVIASGVPEYALMERAGAAAAEIIWRAGGSRDTLVLCGPGNNGGDGFVIARILRAKGVPVRVAALGESRTTSSLQARAAWAGPVESLIGAQPATQLVDALFGTGLTRGLDERVAGELHRLVALASHSHAIDLPSGVETDSGALLSPVPRFDTGIALGALKPAHLLHPAADRMARLLCADIGIAATSDICRLAPPSLHPPATDAHKYSRGLVAVMGGAMAGASLLASHAAARSGAGMVRRIAADTGIAGLDAIVTSPAKTAAAVEQALHDGRLAAVLAGPGLGRDEDARERLNIVLKSGHPLVLDADALNILAEAGVDHLPAGAVLTPHEAEFARLFGDLPGSKIDRALDAARRSRCVVIHKGPDTVIAAPDGRVAVASHGSSWLSTAGTGDVLAGLVAGRLAVTRDGYQAACEAVWLHGEAARRAGVAFVADDLIERLPGAIARRL
ncbi:yjeF C-terminal region, hydroxyethylthiazole kinase-related/yjeF N-terminal region [Sphingobium faniae]|nr:yjeF C-terminal region, hydroxyethylthiazole kinase-related/yjeF N-terminal region [Sphingobium faniae]